MAVKLKLSKIVRLTKLQEAYIVSYVNAGGIALFNLFKVALAVVAGANGKGAVGKFLLIKLLTTFCHRINTCYRCYRCYINIKPRLNAKRGRCKCYTPLKVLQLLQGLHLFRVTPVTGS